MQASQKPPKPVMNNWVGDLKLMRPMVEMISSEYSSCMLEDGTEVFDNGKYIIVVRPEAVIRDTYNLHMWRSKIINTRRVVDCSK